MSAEELNQAWEILQATLRAAKVASDAEESITSIQQEILDHLLITAVHAGPGVAVSVASQELTVSVDAGTLTHDASPDPSDAEIVFYDVSSGTTRRATVADLCTTGPLSYLTYFGGVLTAHAAFEIVSSSATSLAVGPNGVTNPSFQVDSSAASLAAGIKITGKASGSGVYIDAISSGTNENLHIAAKGSGVVYFDSNVSTPYSYYTYGGGSAYYVGNRSNGAVAYAIYSDSGDLQFYRSGAGSDAMTISSSLVSLSLPLSVSAQIKSGLSLAPTSISTAVTRADAKFLFYDFGSTNWAGEGVDAAGNYWIKTGTSSPNILIMYGSNGAVYVSSVAAAVSTSSAAFMVAGGAGIGGTIYVGGYAYVASAIYVGSYSAYNQYAALFSGRTAGSTLEFGHPDSNGYGSVIGANVSDGAPFVAFNAGPGTTVNTFKTLGKKGFVMIADLSGGVIFGQVPTASADNQAITNFVKINSSGALVVSTTTDSSSTSSGSLQVSGGAGFAKTVYVGTGLYLARYSGGQASPTAQLNFGSYYYSGSGARVSHIDMYGGNYGFGVSAGALNYLSGGGHFFYIDGGTTPSLSVLSSGAVTVAGSAYIYTLTITPRININGSIGSYSGFDVLQDTSTAQLWIRYNSDVWMKMTYDTGQTTFYSKAQASVIIQTDNLHSNFLEFKDGAGTPNRWWIGQGLTSTTDGVFTIYDARQSASRMSISTSGYVGVGIGSTTAYSQFEVAYPNTADASVGGINMLTLTSSTTDSAAKAGILFRSWDTTSVGRHAAAIIVGKDGTWTGGGGSYPGYMTFWTRDSAGTHTEKMRITSTGNVGVGVTPSASTKLQVAGRGLFTAGSFDPGDGSPGGVSISYDGTYGHIDAITTGVSGQILKINTYASTIVMSNLGVGGVTPLVAFHVYGASGVSSALQDNSGGTNEKIWDWNVGGGVLYGRAANDAYVSASPWVAVYRSGATPTIVSFPVSYVSIGTTVVSPSSNSLRLSTTNPEIIFEASSGGTNRKLWDILVTPDFFHFRGINDANSLAYVWFQGVRNGSTYSVDAARFLCPVLVGSTSYMPNRAFSIEGQNSYIGWQYAGVEKWVAGNENTASDRWILWNPSFGYVMHAFWGGAVQFYSTATSSSYTTGAMILSGGLGVNGNVNASGYGQFPGGLFTNGLIMNYSYAGIEIGAQGTSNTPYIDFHSSSTSNDYDVRLYAYGGTTSAGHGGFIIYADATTFAGYTVTNGYSAIWSAYAVGVQAGLIQLGWSNAVMRWQVVIESDASYSLYAYNTSAAYIRRGLMITQSGYLYVSETGADAGIYMGGYSYAWTGSSGYYKALYAGSGYWGVLTPTGSSWLMDVNGTSGLTNFYCTTEATSTSGAVNLYGGLFVTKKISMTGNNFYMYGGGQSSTQNMGGLFLNPNVNSVEVTAKTNAGYEGGFFMYSNANMYLGTWAGGGVTVFRYNNADVGYFNTYLVWYAVISWGNGLGYLTYGGGAGSTANVFANTGYNLSFGSNGVYDRVVLTTTGKFKVGPTAIATDYVMEVVNSTATNPYVLYLGATGVNSAFTVNRYFLVGGTNAGTSLLIYTDGSVLNNSGTYGVISERSLKENVTEVSPKFEKFMRVKFWNYNLIGDTSKLISVMADELQLVFPGAVARGAGGNRFVKMSVLSIIHMKAFQEYVHANDNRLERAETALQELRTEMMGEITSLKERVTRLEEKLSKAA